VPSVRVRELLLVALTFTIVALLMTLPLATHLGRALPSDLLDTLLNSWIIGWDADRLRHGFAGLWNAPIFYPYPNTLAFSENLLGIAVFVAPVFWISGNAVLTYNVAFVLSFAIAGTGMYLLTQALTGSRHAAWIGAAAYAFGPFRMAQIAHIQMVATGWLPITLFALHRYFATRSRVWLALFVSGYALQATSNSYVAYFLLLPVTVIVLDGLRRDRSAWLSTVRDLAITGAALALVLAPVVVHYYRARAELGQVRSAHEVETFSADLRSYLVGKNTIGVWRWLPTAVSTDPEKELFPGIVPIALAAIAIGVAWRRRGSPDARGVGMYALIAAAAAVLSLGPSMHVWGRQVTGYGPYGWLYHVVPGWGGMRVPARFAIVVMAALSVMAAFGARAILAPMRPRVQFAATLGLVVALIAEGWAAPIEIHAYTERGRSSDRAAAVWLRDRPAGAVLHLPIRTLVDYAELHHQYVTLVHHHPIVNAYSGWDSPLNALLKDPGSPLYDFERFGDVVRMLRAIGIRYVVVHDEDFNLTQREAHEPLNTLNGFRASGQMVAEQPLVGAVAFELQEWREPVPVPASAPIDPRSFTVSVSQAEDRAANLVDGDLDTRWFGDQDGGGWIAAAFRAPEDVARVELRMAARSLLDYPRRLRVESTDESGATRTLYEAVPYAELLTGVVQNGAYPSITIALPPNQSRTLRIRETAAARRWWSVHELALWRR
jgi:hypothetical protein